MTSQADFDAATANAETLRTRLAAGRENVIVARRGVEVSQDQLNNTVIRAPFAGVVVAKNAQPGEIISPISARGKEIATLRALGFGPLSILVSTIVESATLAMLGGVLGGGLAWLFLNGYTVSTLNGASFSQVVFNFAVSPELLAQGLIAAVIIGLVGGLFPAIRAVRIPVSVALREL